MRRSIWLWAAITVLIGAGVAAWLLTARATRTGGGIELGTLPPGRISKTPEPDPS